MKKIKWYVNLITAVGLLISLTAFSTKLCAREPKEKPYKSTNAEECIQEKECVQYAFFKMTNLIDHRDRPYPNIKINKWNKPLKIKFFGEYKKFVSDVEVYMKETKPLVPIGIGVESGELHNVKIFFTRDIEQSYKDIMPNLHLLSAMGYNKEQEYIKTDGKTSPECGYVRFTDPQSGDITAVVSLIDISRQGVRFCSHLAFYNSMGFVGRSYEGHLDLHPFSIFSNPDDNRLTQLDILLLRLLYSPEIKSGMGYEEVKKVFDEAYANVMKKTY